MSYTEKIVIRTRDCDVYGRWKPSAMLEAMQETAATHCETADLGRGVLDGLGIAWVLSRCRVGLERLPVNGETLSLETFAMPIRHLFFPRAHVFRDPEGHVIGGAQSLWLLMDLRSRRAVANPFVKQRLPIEERESPVGMPATVKPLNDSPVEGSLVPLFTEFDLNGHVNNARYMDWCCNALGFDALREGEIIGFDVNYDGEILPGKALRTSLCRQGDAFTFCGFTGDKRRFAVSGSLRPVS